MKSSSEVFACIAGTGSYLPQKILTNADIAAFVDTSDEWIIERTGIKQRHVVAEHETAATMGLMAAEHALAAAQLSAQDIDLIIVATCTPDKFFPSTACLIQQRLNIQKSIPAFDLSAACAGFIYALTVAEQFIANNKIKNALVIGSEAMSRIIDWQDRSTCVLFGDGAGALILSASDTPGIISSHLHAQGKYQDLLFLPNNIAAPALRNDSPYLQMRGHEVFKLAVQALDDAVDEVLQHNNIKTQDIDWLVPHQANLRIIQAIAKRLQLPMEKVILTIAEHGNTSSASIPLALDVAIRDGRIKHGQTLLMEGFGGGMAWGSVFVRY